MPSSTETTDSNQSNISGIDSDVYAIDVANTSYDWYRKAAAKARRYYRVSEVLAVCIAAAIPLSVLVNPSNGIPAAILGAISAILVGLRAIFHWNEDYARFTRARELVEAERRLFTTHSDQYNNAHSRAAVLVAEITQIEQNEMGQWLGIMRKSTSANQSGAVVEGTPGRPS